MYCKAITKKGCPCMNHVYGTDIYCGKHNKQHYNICSICMEPMFNSIQLNCGHEFCSICVSKWFAKSNSKTCPCCRRQDDSYLSGIEIIENKMIKIYNLVNNFTKYSDQKILKQIFELVWNDIYLFLDIIENSFLKKLQCKLYDLDKQGWKEAKEYIRKFERVLYNEVN